MNFKRTLLISVVAITLRQAGAAAETGANIPWLHDINHAAAESVRLNRPMLVNISTAWCGYCRKMRRETFADSGVVSKITDCFVPVKLNADRNRDFIRRMDVRVYPTTLILSSKLDVIKRIDGFRSAVELTHGLSQFCQHQPRVAPTGLESQDDAESAPESPLFGRLCPVSPVEFGRFMPGDAKVTLIYRGHKLYFQSDRDKRLFQDQPSKYWPVADGSCIVSRVDDGDTRDGSIYHGVRHQGRVWLFASEDHRQKFKLNPDRYVDAFPSTLSARRSVKHVHGHRPHVYPRDQHVPQLRVFRRGPRPE